MTLYSRLVKSRHGIFYYRLQIGGIDKRWSLETRNLQDAKIAAYKIGARIASMKIDPSKIKGWTLRTDGKNVEMITEDNDSDRQSAQAALDLVLKKMAQISSESVQPEQSLVNNPTISLAEALDKYIPVLNASEIEEKSKKMALSTLNKLKLLLGVNFNMSALDDYIIEDIWLEERLKTVERTTAKKDLSFIRSFVEWAASRRNKFTPSKLTFTILAEGENYDYFSQADLKNIFNHLPDHAESLLEFWVVILGLYTGARVGEIVGMRTEFVFEKSGLQVMRLEGTKTAASDRIIPIHKDLVRLGFLEYVETRRIANKTNLFDSVSGGLNGPGAQASKFFTAFKREIGITDKLKVFHSFRHTITDLLNQASVNDKAGSQYTGHTDGRTIRNKVYGRNLLSLEVMQTEVVDKIDWKKYCSWEPDFDILRKRADELLM